LLGPRVSSAGPDLGLAATEGAERPLVIEVAVRATEVGPAGPAVLMAYDPLPSGRLAVMGRGDLAAALGITEGPLEVGVVALGPGDTRIAVDVVDALDVARRVPMTRALVSAEALGPAEAERWLARVANARRILRTRLELVGIFPSLPLTDASSIKLEAARGLAVFTVGEGTPARTTIAVARRKDTGDSLVARLET